MNQFKRVAMMMIVLLMVAGVLTAEDNASSQVKISFMERFRFEGWDNTTSLDNSLSDATGYTRQRTSLGIQWMPANSFELNFKLTNEFRCYLTPKTIPFEIHEVLVDQLYVKLKNVGKLPLAFTLGRQNIMLGEGFLMMDGTPLDGSRALYFNALRADYDLNPQNRLTLFFTYQPVEDNLLPLIHDQHKTLVDQPEQGIGLYYTGKFHGFNLEGYIIRKDLRDTVSRPVTSGITTLGARVMWPILANRLSLTAEAAYQGGSFGNEDRRAMGGYFHFDYQFCKEIPFLKTFTVGGIFLSGDDPDTPKLEAWDPLFSRWPKWSESLVYTLVREGGVAYWSNFKSLYMGLNFNVSERMDLQLTYHHLGAFHEGLNAFTSGDGTTRGNLMIGRLNFKINNYFSGHAVWEHFKPGSYYFSGADSYNWLRFELLLSI